MERVRIDGAELDYEVVGTGEPVVFIHGAFITNAFRPLLAEPCLVGKYRLILYHRRGYPGSGGISKHVSVTRQAAACRALLGHLDVGRAHVVGHSYGGAVALQLALDAPDVAHSLAEQETLDQISDVTRRDSAWRRLLRALYAQPASAFGTTVVLVFVAIALLGPLIAPYSATEQIAGAARKVPSLAHPFGTTPNALPLDAICRAAEISLAPHLGEPAPAPLEAKEFYLS